MKITIASFATHFKNKIHLLFRRWQARVASRYLSACRHDPEVRLYDALSGSARWVDLRVSYCLRCGAMQVITQEQDVDADNIFRVMQPTWIPNPLANVDLMVHPTPQPDPHATHMRLPLGDEPIKAFWGTSHPIPAIETDAQALATHQKFLDSMTPKISDSTIDSIERILQTHGAATLHIKPDGSIESISPEEMRKDWGG